MDVRNNVNIQKTNLNLSTEIAFYIEISTTFKAKNSESGHLNFTKFHEKNLNEWQVCIVCVYIL